MRKRTQIAAIFCAAALGAAALAVQYKWTGDSDSDWDNPDNWYAGGLEGYPSTTNDDALLPASATRYTVDLVTEEIDALEVRADYVFGPVSGSPVLTVNSFLINASGGAVEVSMSGAQITKE